MHQITSTLYAGLPIGNAPRPLYPTHFPTVWQAVIWRNWSFFSAGKLAVLLTCDEETVNRETARMGLKVSGHKVSDNWQNHGYQTIIRDNWHLLPYSQILELLEWTPQKMAYVLKEEDFLWVKLGLHKPDCSIVRYAPLTDEQIRATDLLRKNLRAVLPDENTMEYIEAPFEFVKNYPVIKPVKQSPWHFQLSFIHSFATSCGDVLRDIEANDPLPEALLQRYAALGINGVWMHAILYLLHPIAGAEEYSVGWQIRLENLKVLATRCAKYGLKIFLYLNEPRGMPEAFYETHPDWAGVSFPAKFMRANCTSKKKPLEWLDEALRAIYGAVPELGGAFFITMSENPTHCNSRLTVSECPLCSKRPTEDLFVEVLATASKAIHAVCPSAVVMAEDWSWRDFAGEEGIRPDFEEEDVIRKLPKDVWLLCISEWGLETDIGGVPGTIRDYSISQVGPSKGSLAAWREARKCALKTMAKVQLNNSWELSAIPYIPVPYLIYEHLSNLRNAGVDGLMLNWTLGGYPGGNLELLNYPTVEALAEAKFTKGLAPKICVAWKIFSEAFRHFPCELALLYCAPMNFGPADLLYLMPTGYKATMIGFPYDDLESWRSIYPAEVISQQFLKLSTEWKKGLEFLDELTVTAEDSAQYNEVKTMAQAAYCHLRSTYLQVQFVLQRDSGNRGALPAIVREEQQLALQLMDIVRNDSRIGFEASNHYYYTLQDLAEKVIQCDVLLAQLK